MEFEIRPPKKVSLNVNELWQYRELFFFFVWRDIKVKYKQTFFGVAWAFFQPACMVLIFTVFFSNALSINTDPLPYPVFAYTGLIFWNIFSSGLANSGDSMVTNANIIKKVYFPRLIIPVSAILVALFDFIVSMPFYFILCIFYQVNLLSIKLPLLFFAALILTLITTLGLGTFLSALNVKYRDFRYVLPFLIQVLMFAGPVIYPVSTHNQFIEILMALNPMSAVVNIARAAISDYALQPNLIWISVVSSIAIFFTGIYTFRKTEAFFADLA